MKKAMPQLKMGQIIENKFQYFIHRLLTLVFILVFLYDK